MTNPTPDRLLTSGEVAELFQVTVGAVHAWVREGKLKAIRTPGGMYRYYESEIKALLVPTIAPRADGAVASADDADSAVA